MEIGQQLNLRDEKMRAESAKLAGIESWLGLLAEPKINIKQYIQPKKVITSWKNIAGVDLPVFEQVEFDKAEYDLFLTPLWVDTAVEILRSIVSLRQEVKVLEKGIEILRQELRITTQRVNLFEKVKIPESEENIRVIKVYLGDQMANAVGRSKIAKKKIEQLESILVPAS